eukprot:6490700-Amphidinium_carterae.2
MQIDGVMKDVIIEVSKPYFKNTNTLIQAGMERGSAVGTAGVKLATTSEDDEYIGDESHKIHRSVCGRLQFASPRGPDLLFTLKELGRGLARPGRPTKGHGQLMKHLMRYLRGSSETVLVHVSERTARENTGVGRFRLGRMPQHAQKHQLRNDLVRRCVDHIIREDDTIAKSSRRVNTTELVHAREETHIQLELDASSAIRMGSRVGPATCRGQDHPASEGEGHAAPT